jgi:hypothetical protein
MAWQHISPDVTAKGFIQCCISNAVEGTDYTSQRDFAVK